MSLAISSSTHKNSEKLIQPDVDRLPLSIYRPRSSLREASHIDFVHEKRHMDVGGLLPVTFLGEKMGKISIVYSRFQITFHCNIPNFVAKFGAKFKSSFQNSRASL